MKLTKLLFVVLLGTAMVGCQNQKEQVMPSAEITKPVEKIYGLDDVRSQNGILIFENEKHFADAIDQLQAMPQEKRREWEMLRNFTSQTTIYENVGWADEKVERELIEANSTLSQEEFLKKYPVTVHSEEYYAAIRKGVIKAIIEGDYDIYELTTINPVNAVVLNEIGAAMIGNELTQYTNTQIKHLSGATIDEITTLSKLTESGDRLKIADFGKQERNIINGYNWIENSATVNFGFNRRAKFSVNYSVSTFGNYMTAPARCDNDQTDLCIEQDIVYFIEGKAFKRNFWGTWVDETTASNWLMQQLSWHYHYGYAMLGQPISGGPLCLTLLSNTLKTDVGENYILNSNNAYWWGNQTVTLGILAVTLNRNLRPNGRFRIPYTGVAVVPSGYTLVQSYFSTTVNITSLLATIKCDGNSLGTLTH